MLNIFLRLTFSLSMDILTTADTGYLIFFGIRDCGDLSIKPLQLRPDQKLIVLLNDHPQKNICNVRLLLEKLVDISV